MFSSVTVKIESAGFEFKLDVIPIFNLGWNSKPVISPTKSFLLSWFQRRATDRRIKHHFASAVFRGHSQTIIDKGISSSLVGDDFRVKGNWENPICSSVTNVFVSFIDIAKKKVAMRKVSGSLKRMFDRDALKGLRNLRWADVNYEGRVVGLEVPFGLPALIDTESYKPKK